MCENLFLALTSLSIHKLRGYFTETLGSIYLSQIDVSLESLLNAVTTHSKIIRCLESSIWEIKLLLLEIICDLPQTRFPWTKTCWNMLLMSIVIIAEFISRFRKRTTKCTLISTCCCSCVTVLWRGVKVIMTVVVHLKLLRFKLLMRYYYYYSLYKGRELVNGF